MKQVIVQLGNAMDTAGASVELGILFHSRESMWGTQHFIATRKGIAMAESKTFGWFYSTACLPLSYAPSIESDWEVTIPDEIEFMMSSSKTLEHGIKSSSLLSQLSVHYALRLNVYQATVENDKDADAVLQGAFEFMAEKLGRDVAEVRMENVLSRVFESQRISDQLGLVHESAPQLTYL